MKAKTCSEPELFKALGDRTRYKIVLSLMNRELCACNLPKIVNRAQSTVSLQLKYLSNLGILSSRREGKKIIYSVADRRVYELFKALGHTQFLCSKKKMVVFQNEVMYMKIQILGSGCAKCKILEERVREAVKKAGLKASVEHIYDIDRIIALGVFATPAMVVNGKIVLSGSVPSVNELVEILRGE